MCVPGNSSEKASFFKRFLGHVNYLTSNQSETFFKNKIVSRKQKIKNLNEAICKQEFTNLISEMALYYYVLSVNSKKCIKNLCTVLNTDISILLSNRVKKFVKHIFNQLLRNIVLTIPIGI